MALPPAETMPWGWSRCPQLALAGRWAAGHSRSVEFVFGCPSENL